MKHRESLVALLATALWANSLGAQGYLPIPAGAAVFPPANTKDASGNTYSFSSTGTQLLKTTPGGVVTTIGTAQSAPPSSGAGAQGPFVFTGVYVDGAGNVYAAESPTQGTLTQGYGTGEVILEITPSDAVTTITLPIPSSDYDVPICPIVADSHGDAFTIAPDFSTVEVLPNGSTSVVVPANDWMSLEGTSAGQGPAGLADSYPTSLSIDAAGDLLISGAAEFIGGGPGNVILGSVDFLALGPAPIIVSQPSPVAAPIGYDVTFQVTAAVSGSGPLSFQWYLNGIPFSSGLTSQPGTFQGSALAGSITNTFQIFNVQVEEKGNVTVVVSNSAGSVPSSAAALAVVQPVVYSSSVYAYLSGSSGGVAVDSSGNVYATIGEAVEKVTSVGATFLLAGNLSVAGSADGAGSAALFNYPAGIATDASGNIFVADSGNNSIRKVTPQGVVTTLAGLVPGNADGTGVAAEFNDPTAVAADSAGNIYVADTGNNEVRKISPGGVTSTLLNASSLTFANVSGGTTKYTIRGVAVDSAGNAYVGVAVAVPGVDGLTLNVAALRLGGSSPYTVLFQTLPNSNSAPGPGDGAIAIDTSGTVYVVANNVPCIGPNPIAPGPLASGEIVYPTAIAVDSHGNIFENALNNSTVIELTPEGTVPNISAQPTGSTIAFGGIATLSVVASGSPPPSYQWMVDGVAIPGATSATFNTSIPGTYTVVVTNGAGSVTSGPAVVTAANRIANISSRAMVGTGSNIEIAGFVVFGEPGTTEQVLVRGIGPTLAQFSVAGPLAQPVLTLFDSKGNQLATNTGWNTAANAAAVAAAATTTGAFSLPLDSADSALLISLPPGAYTAQISGAGNSTGVALAEVYEVAVASTQLTNISTRALVGTGSNVEIAGIIVGGAQPSKLLIRAVGPALAQFNVGGLLAKPTLTVVDASGNTIATNAGWSTNSNAATIASESITVGAFALPAGSADCALLLTLPPGAYTAVVSGVGGSSGVALVEAYAAP